MDQLIFASLSHIHYWCEVGMLKVPAVPSSHNTRIGAWVNGKIEGRNPLVVYCTISLIVMQGYRTNTEYTRSWGYSSVYYITSRIGWVSLKRGFTGGIDVDVILGNCTIPFVIRN